MQRKKIFSVVRDLPSEAVLSDNPDLYHDLARIVSEEIGLGKDATTAALISTSWISGRVSDVTIKKDFGDQVLILLQGLKTITSLHVEKSSHHSENFIRLILTLIKDIRVVLIRLAEVLLAIRNPEKLQKGQQKKLAGEVYYLYAPIAHRLGLYRIKTELEDRSMRILFPEDYLKIQESLRATERESARYIRHFIRPLQQKFSDQGFDCEIKGRPKSIHSIWKKMKTQGVDVHEVYDIYAIRIIIGNIPETEKAVCWKVYSLITDMYPPNPARLRDWISAPKPSGYEALHTTVRGPEGRWVEVQIRTRRMDDIAEKGEAAHWKYKAGSISFEPDEWLSGLREKLENPDKQSPDGETAGTIDLADPHIFIFTPQGDLKRLPEGSTVLDFAFSVHSSIGSTCTGANVNGKIVPIKNTLKNGDTVEILTSKNQKPKKDWLTVVVSPRVKQKIRKLLRDEELHEANAGKEILTRKLKNWKIPFAESDVDMIVRRLKYETHMALYYDIATGKLDPLKIKEVIHQDGKGGVPEKELPVPEKKKARDEKSGDVIYLDKNLVNVNYTLASCCTPVFGDEVFGFITISKGISVHRLNCPNARDLQKRYNYRIVHVKWRQISSATSFQATLKIQGIDDMGILNTITDIITHEMEVNIRSVSIESDKGIFKGIIKVFVKDSKQIDALIHRLMKIKGVLKVSRTERNTVGR